MRFVNVMSTSLSEYEEEGWHVSTFSWNLSRKLRFGRMDEPNACANLSAAVNRLRQTGRANKHKAAISCMFGVKEVELKPREPFR